VKTCENKVPATLAKNASRRFLERHRLSLLLGSGRGSGFSSAFQLDRSRHCALSYVASSAVNSSGKWHAPRRACHQPRPDPGTKFMGRHPISHCPKHPKTRMVCPRCIAAKGGKATHAKHREEQAAWGRRGGRPRKKPQSVEKAPDDFRQSA